MSKEHREKQADLVEKLDKNEPEYKAHYFKAESPRTKRQKELEIAERELAAMLKSEGKAAPPSTSNQPRDAMAEIDAILEGRARGTSFGSKPQWGEHYQ